MNIDLDEIIDAIQGGNRDVTYYLNTRSGEIIMRSEHFPIRELNDIDDELDKNWENILELPNQRDVGEVRMMRDFVRDLPAGQAKDALTTALAQPKGVFRRFKDVCSSFNLLNDWYEYEDNRYVEFARRWCEDNEVGFVEIPKIVYQHARRQNVDQLISLKKKQLGLTEEDDSLNFELDRYFSAQLKNGALYQILAWWKNKVVATGGIAWVFTPPSVELPNGRVGYLVNFWVDESMQDNGYDEEILKRLLEEAKRRKLPLVRAFGTMNGLPEKAGFVKDEHDYSKLLKLK